MNDTDSIKPSEDHNSRVRPRFLVDENLAGVTRWLRFFGFDAVTARGWHDREVARFALAESRILITRDRELAEHMPQGSVVWVRSDDLKEQLRAVLRFSKFLSSFDWFSRCTDCNVKLRELERESVLLDERIPDFVKLRDDERGRCWTCDSCGRAYWKGSHYDRAQSFLSEILSQAQGVS